MKTTIAAKKTALVIAAGAVALFVGSSPIASTNGWG